jgi:hypothetical protein
VKPLPALFRARLIPYSFKIRHNEIYGFGLAEKNEVVKIAWEEGINSFILSGGKAAPRMLDGGTVSPENLAGLLADYAHSLKLPLLNGNRHYTIFPFPGKRIFFLSEGKNAGFLLIALALVFFVFMVFSVKNYVKFFFNFRLLLKYSWVIIGLFLLLVLSVRSSLIIYSSLAPLQRLLHLPESFGSTIPAFLLAALIFINLAKSADVINFAGKATVYGLSALLTGLLGLIEAVFLDFVYIPLFLWAFIFIFLGSVIRIQKAVYLCAILAPLYAFIVLINIIDSGSLDALRRLTEIALNTPGNWSPAIHAALFFLPLYLIVKRAMLINNPITRINKKT